MSDSYLPGYVDAPLRARAAQAALIFQVLATGALHLLAAVVLAIYGPAGYRQDAGVGLVSHGLVSLGMFAIGLATIVVGVGAPIAVLVWLHRASKNAHAIARRPLEHSPAMAIGAWFIPFANLWVPLAVVREIEVVSDPETHPVSSPDTSWWWGTYLLGNILGLFASEVVRPSTPTVVVGVLATIAHATSAFMLARIISRISTSQRVSAQRRRWADVFADDAPEPESVAPSADDDPAASAASSSWTA